jgi:hypothetical protein
MLHTRLKKKKSSQKKPRVFRYVCVWCEKDVYSSQNNWVADGAGEILHDSCYQERLGIINENRKKHPSAL